MSKPDSLLLRLPAYEETVGSSFSLSVLVPVYNERHLVESRPHRSLRRARRGRARCADVPDVDAPGAGEVAFDVLAFPINPADSRSAGVRTV
jgi:hypothetical protein